MITIVIILRLLLCRSTNVRFWRHEKQFCEDLFSMRKLIDQYAADKGKLPQSPDLITEHYMRELPVDPITGAKLDGGDW